MHNMPTLKTQYLVVGLSEDWVLTEAYLSSSGLSTERELLVLGNHLKTFDTKEEAIQWIQESAPFKSEHGVTIIETYQ